MKNKKRVSDCCHAPVVEAPKESAFVFACSKCGKPGAAVTIPEEKKGDSVHDKR